MGSKYGFFEGWSLCGSEFRTHGLGVGAKTRLNVHEACRASESLVGACGCGGWLGVVLPLRPVIKRTVPLRQGWEETVGVKAEA